MKILARIRAASGKILKRPRRYILSFSEMLICDRLGIPVETYLQHRKNS